MMTIIGTIASYLGVIFLGIFVGVVVTIIILVKKNGKQYAQIGEEVRNERMAAYEESEENEENSEEPDSSDDIQYSDISAESDSVQVEE